MKILKAVVRNLKQAFVKNKLAIIYWKTKTFATKSSFLGVTYANDKFIDGAGAQLQRIYGIYAIARFLNLEYVHSPINTLHYEGLADIENGSCNQDIESKYNNISQMNCIWWIHEYLQMLE